MSTTICRAALNCSCVTLGCSGILAGVWDGLRQGEEAPAGLAGEPVGGGLGWEGLSWVGGTEAGIPEVLLGEMPSGMSLEERRVLWRLINPCPGFGLLVPLGLEMAA